MSVCVCLEGYSIRLYGDISTLCVKFVIISSCIGLCILSFTGCLDFD